MLGHMRTAVLPLALDGGHYKGNMAALWALTPTLRNDCAGGVARGVHGAGHGLCGAQGTVTAAHTLCAARGGSLNGWSRRRSVRHCRPCSRTMVAVTDVL